MFLYQKFNYKKQFITVDEFYLVEEAFKEVNPQYICFDTETDGLNIILNLPFLQSFGFGKYVFVAEMNAELVAKLYDLFDEVEFVFIQNVNFDHHMMTNIDLPPRRTAHFADLRTVARLTEFADSDIMNFKLETIGTRYVDPEAKFAGKVIRQRIAKINAERWKKVKELFLKRFPKASFSQARDAYLARVQFVMTEDDEFFDFFDIHMKIANYKDVYELYPDLMISYAADDIVIMLEYLEQSLPTMMETDPGLVTFKRESDLVPHICTMERVGFKADVDYMLESRMRTAAYGEILENELHEILQEDLTARQFDKLIDMFKRKYGIILDSVDESHLEDVINLEDVPEEAIRVAELLIEIRKVTKIISTYIDGKLNSVTNGRLYTSINNAGAVSGRVSSNLQQQSRDALVDRDGNELFHPRKCFLADDGYYLFFLDFNQMELRYQAYYTLLMGKGDFNMCRAFIPYLCTSLWTDEVFDPKNPEHITRWDSGEWIDENYEIWTKTDLHAITTFIAFPHLNNDPKHPEFKKLRKLGKQCNFLKNYQGGVKAIIANLKVKPNVAEVLDKAYYTAFPEVRTYQKWVTKQMTMYGFVENFYGRRYYMESSNNYYKVGNYLIQGGCADMVKQKEIEISEYLEGSPIKFVLPIHDELVFSVPKDHIKPIPHIKAIMQNVWDVMPWIPMVSEIEYTETNWADKKPWEGEFE